MNGRIYRKPITAEIKTRIILAVGFLAYLLALIPNLIDLF